MAKWQCGKLIGARLCAPFFVCAHAISQYADGVLSLCLMERWATGIYALSSWCYICFSFCRIEGQ